MRLGPIKTNGKSSRHGWLLCLAMLSPAPTYAAMDQALSVGNGPGQIGLIERPNEDCYGPAAIAPDAAGNLAVLDKLNRKIVLVMPGAVKDIPLPEQVREPQDLLVAHKGYAVAGAFGDVALLGEDGHLIAAVKVGHNPESGDVRIFPRSETELELHSLSGEVSKVALPVGKVGGLIKQQVMANGYKRQSSATPDRAVFINEAVQGPLQRIEVTASMRIAGARVVWADTDEALVAIQESRTLPQPASFVRLARYDANSKPVQAVYVAADAFGCDIRRPYTRLHDGRVVALAFPGKEQLALRTLPLRPIDEVQPIPLAAASDAALISDQDDILKSLEQANGTSDALLIALDSISRATILERARAALTYSWQLKAANYLHANTESLCKPPEKIWQRPARLDGLSDQQAVGIPYRWGGYVSTLAAFQDQLDKGWLAGDICTCRTGNCVHPLATGQDCSGFVSYAWRTGKYFTTASLPAKSVSTSIRWVDLKPGDIVNKARSHVMLIEEVKAGPEGRLITVIESTPRPGRCGGVCRNTHAESFLQERQYLPFRRLAVTD